MLGRDGARDHEDASADRCPHPDQGEVQRPQRTVKLHILGNNGIGNPKRVAHGDLLMPRSL